MYDTKYILCIQSNVFCLKNIFEFCCDSGCFKEAIKNNALNLLTCLRNDYFWYTKQTCVA